MKSSPVFTNFTMLKNLRNLLENPINTLVLNLNLSLSYKLVRMLSICLCVCLSVNQGGTNHNRCTQRLVILHAQNYYWTPISRQKPGQSELNQFIFWPTFIFKYLTTAVIVCLCSCLIIGFRSRGRDCCLMGRHLQSTRKASTTTTIWLTVCWRQASSHLWRCFTGTCLSHYMTLVDGPTTNSFSISTTMHDCVLRASATGYSIYDKYGFFVRLVQGLGYMGRTNTGKCQSQGSSNSSRTYRLTWHKLNTISSRKITGRKIKLVGRIW